MNLLDEGYFKNVSCAKYFRYPRFHYYQSVNNSARALLVSEGIIRQHSVIRTEMVSHIYPYCLQFQNNIIY